MRLTHPLVLLLLGQAGCAPNRVPQASDQWESERTSALELALIQFRPGVIDTIIGPPDTTVYIADTSRIVLMLHRDAHVPPFDPTWVADLVRRRIIIGSCEAAHPLDCPMSVNARFVSLGEPIAAGSYLTLTVEDVELNPERRRQGHGRISAWSRTIVLTRNAPGLKIQPARPDDLSLHGDAVCG
jgi:hypothetical protein